jgi:Phosphotransferase enzyme family
LDSYVSNQSEDLLKPLPLVFAHGDINGLNILTNGDGEISGVIDWEESSWKPFGFCFYGLKTFLENTVGDEVGLGELTKVFKDTLWDALPATLSSKRKELQQCATVAHIIDIFYRVFEYCKGTDDISEYQVGSLEQYLRDVDVVDLKRSSTTNAYVLPGNFI